MSYEVECGECSELILIEDLGVEVACPHCDAILILHESDLVPTTEEPPSREGGSDPSGSVPADQPAPTGAGDPAPTDPVADAEAAADGTAINEAPTDDDGGASEAVPNFDFLGQGEPEEIPHFQIDTSEDRPAPKQGSVAATDDSKPFSTDKQKSAQSPEPVPAKSSRSPRRRVAREASVPNSLAYKSLMSYAILVTLALLYLMYSYRSAKPHQLESLPDIQPWKEGEFIKIEENAVLPPGHSLRLGETRRFGNIKVTPLRVTREPLQFVHFEGAGAGDKRPTEPVIKLWLRIENVSRDQKFPPLDPKLALIRYVDSRDYRNVMANTWVCRRNDLPTKQNRVLMYDHPHTSSYNIKGMPSQPVGPGDSIETFLPTQSEGLESLKGELVWRFQIRKGFHPRSMNGVTTLVEVLFDSRDISPG
jgi:hypothetical protein